MGSQLLLSEARPAAASARRAVGGRCVQSWRGGQGLCCGNAGAVGLGTWPHCAAGFLDLEGSGHLFCFLLAEEQVLAMPGCKPTLKCPVDALVAKLPARTVARRPGSSRGHAQAGRA